MNKPVPAPSSTVFCGIDISAGSLSVAVIEPDHPLAQREFAKQQQRPQGADRLAPQAQSHGARLPGSDRHLFARSWR